jgi:hypothetical protein
MIFIETSTFTKLIGTYLSDDEYLGLQRFLLKYPDAGANIRGTGGVRKLRWGASGRGKRGGGPGDLLLETARGRNLAADGVWQE